MTTDDNQKRPSPFAVYGHTGLEGFLVLAATKDNFIFAFEQFEATAEVLYEQFKNGPGIQEAFMLKVLKKSGDPDQVPLESQFNKGPIPAA